MPTWGESQIAKKQLPLQTKTFSPSPPVPAWLKFWRGITPWQEEKGETFGAEAMERLRAMIPSQYGPRAYISPFEAQRIYTETIAKPLAAKITKPLWEKEAPTYEEWEERPKPAYSSKQIQDYLWGRAPLPETTPYGVKFGIKGMAEEVAWAPLWVLPGRGEAQAAKVSTPAIAKFIRVNLEKRGIEGLGDIVKGLGKAGVPKDAAERLTRDAWGMMGGKAAKAAEKIPEVAPKVGGIVPPVKPLVVPKPISDIISPNLAPNEVDGYLQKFSEILTSPKTEKVRELALEMRKKVLAAKISAFQSRAEQFIIEGVNPEEAIRRATSEAMGGKLPDVTTTVFDDIAKDMRDVLFSRVYQKLEKEPFELLDTAEALRNALAGKSIPRIVGIKGQSAYTRLLRVFGDNPEIMKALDKPKSLKEIVEDMFYGMKEPKGVDPEMANYFKNLPTVPYGQARLGELPWEFRPMVSDLRTSAQKELDLQTFKTELADLVTPEPPSLGRATPEIPIGNMVKQQLPGMPLASQNILVNALKKAGLTIVDIGNFLRANLASADFSFWRQQAPMILAHPKRFAQANVKALRALVGEEAATQSWHKITQSPLYGVYDDLGLDFLRPAMGQPGVPEWKLVEEYGYAGAKRPISKLTAKLPWVKVSQRAFTTGTNEHNWGMFTDFYNMLLKVNEESALGKVKPINMKGELTKFGKMLEDLSGRGSLGKARGIASGLSGMFFAPRMFVGRVLTPRHLFSSSKYVRGEAWKNLGSFVAGISGVMLLGKQMGWWDVGTDSRSSDYMKIKIGNTRIDPWGGYQQLVTFFSRAVQQTGISSTTGEEYQTNPWDSLTRLMRSKAAPLASLISELWTGKTFLGEDFDVKNKKQWIDRVAPMAVAQLYETYMDNWVTGVATTIPSLVGAGVQTYKGKPSLTTIKQQINKAYGIDITKEAKPSRLETLQGQLSEEEWAGALQFYKSTYENKVAQEISSPGYRVLPDEDKRTRISSLQSDSVDEMIRKYQKTEIVKPLTPTQQYNRIATITENNIWSQYSPNLRQLSDQIIKLENSDNRNDMVQARQLLMQHPEILAVRRKIAIEKARIKREMAIQSRR